MRIPVGEFLSRHRWGLGVLLCAAFLSVVLVQTVPFPRMAWGALTGTPKSALVEDVRHALLSQQHVRDMLADHEREAVRSYQQRGSVSYQRRHLVEVNLTPLGLPGFYDVFAVRVRTDIVNGEPYTSFLARPGVVIDPNATAFFSGQCGGSICRGFVQALVGTGHTLLEWNVLTPYRLNVTEMDTTSSVSIGRKAISANTWARQSRSLHQDGIGQSFAPAAK